EHGVLRADRIEEAEDVITQVFDVVALQLGRLRRAAVAALVGRDHVVAGLGDGGYLVAPRVPKLGEAVAQHDDRPFARLGDVHVDAVGGDGAVGDVGHGTLS